MVEEKAIIETINFASGVIQKNPGLSLKYLSMIPEEYRNHPKYKENIDIIEFCAKEKNTREELKR